MRRHRPHAIIPAIACAPLLMSQVYGCGADQGEDGETESSDNGQAARTVADETGQPGTEQSGGNDEGAAADPAGRVLPTADWRNTAMHMRLQDDLDRPQDGWCLDVVGSGPHIRFDMPLIGHNCKPGLFADEAVEFTEDGQIRFPAYPGYCVTVMGLNQYALAGAALMLKRCGEEIPFLNAPQFQTFELLDNGMVRLQGSDLCITVGDTSERTFDPTHAWRTLYMERCDECDPARSTWRFVRP